MQTMYIAAHFPYLRTACAASLIVFGVASSARAASDTMCGDEVCRDKTTKETSQNPQTQGHVQPDPATQDIYPTLQMESRHVKPDNPPEYPAPPQQ